MNKAGRATATTLLAAAAMLCLCTLVLALLLGSGGLWAAGRVQTGPEAPPPPGVQQAVQAMYGLNVQVTGRAENSTEGILPPDEVMALASGLAEELFSRELDGFLLLDCTSHILGDTALYWRACGDVAGGGSVDLLLDAVTGRPVYGNLSSKRQATPATVRHINARTTATGFTPTPPAGYGGGYITSGIDPLTGSRLYNAWERQAEMAGHTFTLETERAWLEASGLLGTDAIIEGYCLYDGPFGAGMPFNTGAYRHVEFALQSGRYLSLLVFDDSLVYNFSFSDASYLALYPTMEEEDEVKPE